MSLSFFLLDLVFDLDAYFSLSAALMSTSRLYWLIFLLARITFF